MELIKVGTSDVFYVVICFFLVDCWEGAEPTGKLYCEFLLRLERGLGPIAQLV